MSPLRSFVSQALLVMTALSASATPLRVFVGTYTGTTSRGIYATRFDPAKGTFTEPVLAAETPNPSFLGVSPDLKVLYAVNESPAGVRAFSISATGSLSPLGEGSSAIVGPCDVAADPSGRLVAVADYSGGSVAAFRVLPNGALGERTALLLHPGKSIHPQRQEKAHAHGVTFSRDGRFLVVPDLGIDQVKVYAVDREAATLRPQASADLSITPGSGPRHAAFSRDGKQLYVINELSSTITVANYDTSSGSLHTVQTISTLPTGNVVASTTAEIAVHPGDRFVYGSNRGHDSIAVFERDRKSGTLSLIEIIPTGGKTPRHFTLSPDGAWLIAANQESDTLTVFAVSPQSGKLTRTSHQISIPRPVCVRFVAQP